MPSIDRLWGDHERLGKRLLRVGDLQVGFQDVHDRHLTAIFYPARESPLGGVIRLLNVESPIALGALAEWRLRD